MREVLSGREMGRARINFNLGSELCKEARTVNRQLIKAGEQKKGRMLTVWERDAATSKGAVEFRLD